MLGLACGDDRGVGNDGSSLPSLPIGLTQHWPMGKKGKKEEMPTGALPLSFPPKPVGASVTELASAEEKKERLGSSEQSHWLTLETPPTKAFT